MWDMWHARGSAVTLIEQLYRALVNMPCSCNLAYRRAKDTPIELCQRCAAVERYERELAESTP